MRYLPVATILLGLGFGVAHAAASFDGHWKGSWSGTSGTGMENRTAGTQGCQSFHGNIDMTVNGGAVTGETTGQFHGPISGTVADDGKFTGKIGGFPMEGTFSTKRFQGRITTSRCVARVSARPQAPKP